MAVFYPVTHINRNIVVSGDGGEQSVSRMRAQVQHDNNAANLGLITDFLGLPESARRHIIKTSAGRAWKWDKRHNGRKIFLCASFWINVISYILPARYTPLVLTKWLLNKTLAPFGRSENIRTRL
jgi:predicted Mrr-cat superfamily restriction endonuclease